MATKTYRDEEFGQFEVRKNKNARKITLRIAKTGNPSVTVPNSVPFVVGVKFFNSNREWVRQHHNPVTQFRPGDTYELYEGTRVQIHEAETRNSTRRKTGELQIFVVAGDDTYARKSIEKHLAEDSKQAIEPRIREFAPLLGVTPTAVRYRATTSRWGSCNSRAQLTFASFISQLPNDLIDYIVIHELSHIHEMNHSDRFWAHVERLCPDHKALRKELKSHELKPDLKKL